MSEVELGGGNGGMCAGIFLAWPKMLFLMPLPQGRNFSNSPIAEMHARCPEVILHYRKERQLV